MTDRFDILREGALFQRADSMLKQVAATANYERPHFVRVIRTPDASAFSNGSAIVYVTSGAVLRANDAQLFMMLAHEIAHLNARNLHVTQYEKGVERAAQDYADRARGITDDFDEEPEDESKCSPPDDASFGTGLMSMLVCEGVRRAVPVVVSSVAGSIASGARNRLATLESDMDAWAYDLGIKAGFDPVNLISTFQLLDDAVNDNPFLAQRAQVLSARRGLQTLRQRVPVGSVPFALSASLGADALDELDAIARNDRLFPERRIKVLNRVAGKLLPIYHNDARFRAGVNAYLIAYGGFIGIDPALIRYAIADLYAMGVNAVGPDGLIGSAWFGCNRVDIRGAFRAELPTLNSYAGPDLSSRVRRALVQRNNIEREEECAEDS